MQKEIGSERSFGLIHILAEQSPQMLKKMPPTITSPLPTLQQAPKIFNNNTVKVSYCCTQNVASIIKSHNKKLINTSIKSTLPCKCRKKHEYPLDGKCRPENIVYKCITPVHGYLNKVYLGPAGDFKQRFQNRRMLFNNEGHSTDTTISKYVLEVKRKLQIMPSLKWYTIKSVPAYSNISKKCYLLLPEKFEILNNPNPNELLNKISELISKCRHVNKFLLSNYKSNDQTFWKMSHQKYIMTF